MLRGMGACYIISGSFIKPSAAVAKRCFEDGKGDRAATRARVANAGSLADAGCDRNVGGEKRVKSSAGKQRVNKK